MPCPAPPRSAAEPGATGVCAGDGSGGFDGASAQVCPLVHCTLLAHTTPSPGPCISRPAAAPIPSFVLSAVLHAPQPSSCTHRAGPRAQRTLPCPCTACSAWPRRRRRWRRTAPRATRRRTRRRGGTACSWRDRRRRRRRRTPRGPRCWPRVRTTACCQLILRLSFRGTRCTRGPAQRLCPHERAWHVACALQSTFGWQPVSPTSAALRRSLSVPARMPRITFLPSSLAGHKDGRVALWDLGGGAARRLTHGPQGDAADPALLPAVGAAAALAGEAGLASSLHVVAWAHGVYMRRPWCSLDPCRVKARQPGGRRRGPRPRRCDDTQPAVACGAARQRPCDWRGAAAAGASQRRGQQRNGQIGVG